MQPLGSRYAGCGFAIGSRRALLVVGTCACAVSAASAPPASARVLRIRGAAASLSGAVAHAARVGAAPAGQPLQLVLPLRVDGVGLERFAATVSTPGSPFYGRYLSVGALARRFGASRTAATRVVHFLRAHGATDVKVDATGLLAEATMSARLAERLFATPLAQFRTADRTRFLAPVAAIRMPAPLRGLVDGVVGLDTEPQIPSAASALVTAAARSHATAVTAAGRSYVGAHAAAAQPSSALKRTGTPAGCAAGVAAGQQDQNPGFTPNQYLTAYDFGPLYDTSDMGQGETVALIEIDGYSYTDLATFAQCFGFRVPTVNAYGVGVNHSLPAMGEATLDLEVLDAAAPGLSAIDVYETKADAADTLAAFAAPLQNARRRPQVVSASLGLCESEAYDASGAVGIEATERILEVEAAAGVTVLAASGDNGSADCQSEDGEPIDALGINYPASSRWVTAVGGTNVSLTAANQIAGQQVWNDTTVATAAGGGGVSSIFTRPTYQEGVVPVNRREVPDVSMLADLLPGYSIYCTATPACLNAQNSNPWLTVGGTSAATPLLAGGIAIVDQVLRASDHENLGLLNPLLYKLGGSTAASGVFYNVTSIGNDIGPYIEGGNGLPLGCCTATAGYSDAAGWGSVAIAGLAAQATQLVPPIIKFSLTLPKHQQPVAHRELLASVSCSAACSIGAFADIKVGRSKPFVVTSRLFDHQSTGPQMIPVKFSAAQLRTLHSALAHHKTIVATVYGALIDALGAIQNQTAGRKLDITE